MTSGSQPGSSHVPVQVRVALALAIVAVPVLVLVQQRAAAEADRDSADRFQGIGTAMTNYLGMSSQHVAPRLSTDHGQLAFDVNVKSDSTYLGYHSLLASVYPDGIVDDSQLLYLGYMVEDGQDVETLATYYTDRMFKGESLEDTIPLPKPRRDGRNVLLRVQRLDHVPPGSAWSGWYSDPSVIPVFIERVGSGAGAHVVFLDGHVAYYPYARSNVWPMERHARDQITQMDEPSPDTTR